MNEQLVCEKCSSKFPINVIRYDCDCGGLLTVERDKPLPSAEVFDNRLGSRHRLDQSGVWRFREAVLDVHLDHIVSHPEGRTSLHQRAVLSKSVGIEKLYFKHEGENPSGSFKDRGMTVAVTQAKRLGARAIACASTGNTSASLATYAAHAGLGAVVFLPAGKVAVGKLSQTLGYGAQCLAVRGDFDVAMRLVVDACKTLGIYLVNSINPFRIEGQKTIVFDLLQDLQWKAPDWIVVPAGNLGNTSAFGKALFEAHKAKWIDKLPRIASVQAAGANPFYQGFAEGFKKRHKVQAETVATAIRIGDPVSWDRAVKAIAGTNGVVCQVTDGELMTAKREIDASGLGCEPASACTLAGVRQLKASGVIKANETVVCVLTGNILKDTDAILKDRDDAPSVKPIVEIDATLEAVKRAVKV